MKKIISIIVLLIICSVFVFAGNCPPSIPKTYYGEVSYDGNLLIGNYEVRAVMGSDTVGISDVSSGNYLIDVSPCFGQTGEIIFYINGIEANEEGSYDGQDDWGKSENLNLTVNEIPPASITCGDGVIQSGEECDGTNLAGRSVNDCGTGWAGTISCSSTCEIDYSNCISPYCGDGSCNNGETCTICSQDCGACAIIESSSGGGSSGGGGGGGGSSSPIILTPETEEETNDGILEPIATPISEVGTQKTTSSGITGAVIGFVKTGKGIGLIFVGLIIIVGIGVMTLKKRASKNG